ncbi:MAG: hypothetical protein HY243_03185 [Proteobacteria bacterium]|nr:hypothetical protein [Pseudomonadota bacterium]
MHGRVEGNIRARILDLRSTSNVAADIVHRVFEVAHGAVSRQ